MSNRANDAVSIQLRNLGSDLEEESDKEDGKGRAVEEIPKEPDKATQWWNTFFLMLCAFAVFVDPLFCYIYVIDRKRKCISYDPILLWAYIGLRIAIDVFYVIDIIIFLHGCTINEISEKFRACCGNLRNLKQEIESGNYSMHRRLHGGALNNLSIERRCLLLPRILVALPIPEGLVAFAYYASFDEVIYVIFVTTSFQYMLRVFLIYGSKRWHPVKKTTTGRWLKPLLDFLPFILASHIFGGLWYSLAVQRQVDCWKPHCADCTASAGIKRFHCQLHKEIMHKQLEEQCPTDNENKKKFDFGIYFYALQSDSISTSNLPQRISQSFWWALRNLSSFGSNMQTSMHTSEIYFSIAVSISGMALFLVYLNARVQESQESQRQESEERLLQRKLKEKNHLMKPDIDLWLSKNVPKSKTMTNDSKDLKTSNIKKNVDVFRAVIIDNIHKLEENKAIDVQNIIFILPLKYKADIKRLLCLASLKEVPMLANLNEKILKVICEHLKPVIYIEDNYIVQEGKPLGMMLFITQGIAWTYTIGDNDGARPAKPSCGSSSRKWLKRGDYYGDELLEWAFKCPSSYDIPISSRTVVSQEKVEAFALRATDLQSIVSRYWWGLPLVEPEKRENLAASSIQAVWRSRLPSSKHSQLAAATNLQSACEVPDCTTVYLV